MFEEKVHIANNNILETPIFIGQANFGRDKKKAKSCR